MYLELLELLLELLELLLELLELLLLLQLLLPPLRLRARGRRRVAGDGGGERRCAELLGLALLLDGAVPPLESEPRGVQLSLMLSVHPRLDRRAAEQGASLALVVSAGVVV